jgi:hypothetical protein
MTIEPVILPAQTEMPVVETRDHVAAQEPPTEQQQRTADDLFTPEQEKAAQALLAIQMGVGLAHSLAIDAFRKDPEPPVRVPPKKRPEEDEER